MPDALMIPNGIIYGVSVAKGELFIVMAKNSVFYEKYTWKRED